MRPLVFGLLGGLAAACSGEGMSEQDAFFAIAGCPSVQTGSYSVHLTTTDAIGGRVDIAEATFLSDDGLLEATPGCKYANAARRAGCSVDISLQCPVRRYIGNVAIVAPNVLRFSGEVVLGSGPTNGSIEYRKTVTLAGPSPGPARPR